MRANPQIKVVFSEDLLEDINEFMEWGENNAHIKSIEDALVEINRLLNQIAEKNED